MKSLPPRLIVTALVGTLLAFGFVCPGLLRAQNPWGGPPPTTRTAQRNALATLRSQVSYFQNTTRTAPSYATGGYGMMWEQFQSLRGAYNAFKATLNPQQLAAGANELAELDAGLDILQEAFTDYQQEAAAGQGTATAFRRMCQDLYEAAAVWWQELKRDCARLRAG